MATINDCKCGEAVQTEEHICPYWADVNGDNETLCKCCLACQSECGDDI